MREIDDYTILPCPICGSVDLHISRLVNECLSGTKRSWTTCAIECAGCGICVLKQDLSEAVRAWNTRCDNSDS